MSENESLSQNILPFVNASSNVRGTIKKRRETCEETVKRSVMFLDEQKGKLTRLEELIVFAKRIKAKKIGIAYCCELKQEAERLHDILEMHGFVVFEMPCKFTVNSITCNTIAQAKSLNQLRTHMNITLGLCVGNDALFTKYAKALSTNFITKDLVLGHNSVMGLHMTGSFEPRSVQSILHDIK